MPDFKATSEEINIDDAIKVELVGINDFQFEFQMRIWQQFMRDPSDSIYRSVATSF